MFRSGNIFEDPLGIIHGGKSTNSAAEIHKEDDVVLDINCPSTSTCQQSKPAKAPKFMAPNLVVPNSQPEGGRKRSSFNDDLIQIETEKLELKRAKLEIMKEDRGPPR